jgi:hypothetical protein
MKLNKTAIVNIPPNSDESGNLITSEPLHLDELKIIYCDSPSEKRYYVNINDLNGYGAVELFYDDEYDAINPITIDIAQAKLEELFGDDPGAFLSSLYPETLEQYPNGAGTILAGMIKSLGIKVTSSCSCKRHAMEMNKNGNDWCDKNIDTVISWLKEESNRRCLPFIEAIVKMMVNRAISKSRKLLAGT